MDTTEALYREGMLALQTGDLETALDRLEAAREASGGPDGEQSDWWFSASRGLAWLALEQGDPETAETRLRLLPAHDLGIAQQSSVRAHVALAAGEPYQVSAHVSAAVHHLLLDTDDDTASLMNGAIVLETCGSALVALRYGQEAERLIAMARGRIEQAGVVDAYLEEKLAEIEIGAALLIADGTSLSRSDPVETWALKALESAVRESRPYAVVVRINVTESGSDFASLVEEVTATLALRPTLGHVDGIGSNGEVWELFLDGDDPTALWETVEPLVRVYVTPGSEVELRTGRRSITHPLSPTR